MAAAMLQPSLLTCKCQTLPSLASSHSFLSTIHLFICIVSKSTPRLSSLPVGWLAAWLWAHLTAILFPLHHLLNVIYGVMFAYIFLLPSIRGALVPLRRYNNSIPLSVIYSMLHSFFIEDTYFIFLITQNNDFSRHTPAILEPLKSYFNIVHEAGTMKLLCCNRGEN